MSPEMRCKHGFLRSVVPCPVCDVEKRRKKGNGDYYEPSRRRTRGFAEEVTASGDYRCAKCGLIKPVSEFYVSRYSRRGHQSSCKRCDNNKRSQKMRQAGVVA